MSRRCSRDRLGVVERKVVELLTVDIRDLEQRSEPAWSVVGPPHTGTAASQGQPEGQREIPKAYETDPLPTTSGGGGAAVAVPQSPVREPSSDAMPLTPHPRFTPPGTQLPPPGPGGSSGIWVTGARPPAPAHVVHQQRQLAAAAAVAQSQQQQQAQAQQQQSTGKRGGPPPMILPPSIAQSSSSF